MGDNSNRNSNTCSL